MVFLDHWAQPHSTSGNVNTRVPGVPVIFEDQWLIIVNKPSGLLSQPGRVEPDSVVSRVLAACPEITGPSLVHRLDMDTSGLLMLAKNRCVHRHLQQLFERRLIDKRYSARLTRDPLAQGGRIELLIRPDINDRPRQIVCNEHGKVSITLWRSAGMKDKRDVWFYPLTGRTHQLRVHAAHSSGLNNPIVGDRLYGEVGKRLMLHADRLTFDHPVTGEQLQVQCPAVFESSAEKRLRN